MARFCNKNAVFPEGNRQYTLLVLWFSASKMDGEASVLGLKTWGNQDAV